MDSIQLSHSKLSVMKECVRCFYDANSPYITTSKIERPRGIVASIMNGVDGVMKEVFDSCRPKLPLHMAKDPRLADAQLWGTHDQIKRLRNWKSGLKATLQIAGIEVRLIGALDDLLIHANSTYSPWDTKTKGDVPKDDGAKYYQSQLDMYALFLRENGMRPSGRGFLNYWYPTSMTGNEMEWGNVIYELTAIPDRAVEFVHNAITVLQSGQPVVNPSCEYCKFAEARKK